MTTDTTPDETDSINIRKNLTSCLFDQYAFTFTGVTAGTGYALYKKPPNGMAIMMLAGATGTLLDLTYGWFGSCRPQVEAYQQLVDLEQRQAKGGKQK